MQDIPVRHSEDDIKPRVFYSFDVLTRKLYGYNENINNVVRQEIVQKQRKDVSPDDLISQIIILIANQRDLHEVTAVNIAAQLNMSERTLNRQLSKFDTSFRTIVKHYKRQMAIRLLAEGEDILAITDYLDFSDRSNFERAFKEWVGMTPAQFRDINMTVTGFKHQHDYQQADSMPAISSSGLQLINMITMKIKSSLNKLMFLRTIPQT